MKKPWILPVAVTLVFLVGTLCFFLIRNLGSRDIQVNSVPVPSVSQNETTAQNNHGNLYTKKININDATRLELMTLPGIGETLAQRIIDHRSKNGPFQTPQDLCNVEGIGEKKLAQILEYITVGGSQ